MLIQGGGGGWGLWVGVWGWGGGFNPCTAESRHWQNHTKYILDTNASLLLCKEASVVTISSDVKYAISTLNSSNVLPTTLY